VGSLFAGSHHIKVAEGGVQKVLKKIPANKNTNVELGNGACNIPALYIVAWPLLLAEDSEDIGVIPEYIHPVYYTSGTCRPGNAFSQAFLQVSQHVSRSDSHHLQECCLGSGSRDKGNSKERSILLHSVRSGTLMSALSWRPLTIGRSARVDKIGPDPTDGYMIASRHSERIKASKLDFSWLATE